MLQAIRDRATGWIAWGIVIFISIPFALWGIQQYVQPGGQASVATVNGTELSYRTLQVAIQRQRAQIQAALGRSDIDEERLRKAILDNLVNDEVMIQAGVAEGMRIADSQLALAIQTQEIFQAPGGFSQELYDGWLSSQGYSPGGFEYDLRRSMLTEQFNGGVAASAFVTRHDMERALRLVGQKRTFVSLTIPAEKFRGEAPSEEAIKARFEAEKSRYVTPEEVNLRYVELSRAGIAETITATDEELRALFETRKANFAMPSSRTASHILVRLAADADQAAVDAATAKLADLRSRLEAGEAFEELAREHSEDPGSAAQGGDLGAFGRGVMDPAFEEAAFSLPEGAVSEPVRSSFGMHLIKVTAVQEGGERAFEDVRDDVLKDYRDQEVDQIFSEQAEQVATLAFEHPESLEIVSESLGLEIRETGFFRKEGGSSYSGIAAFPTVREVGFSAGVVESGNNSELLDLGGDRIAVVRLAEHRPSRPQTLDEVREVIAGELQDEAAAEAAAKAGEELLRRLRAGEDPKVAASGVALEWTESREVDRVTAGADAPLARALFRMPRPGERAVYDAVVRDNGDLVIIGLEKVVDGEVPPLDDPNVSPRRAALAQAIGRGELEGLQRAIRSAADVVIFEQSDF